MQVTTDTPSQRGDAAQVDPNRTDLELSLVTVVAELEQSLGVILLPLAVVLVQDPLSDLPGCLLGGADEVPLPVGKALDRPQPLGLKSASEGRRDTRR